MKKYFLLILLLPLLTACMNENEVSDRELVKADEPKKANVQEEPKAPTHIPRDDLYNHLDFDIEVYIKEQDGLLRPGLYNEHTEETIIHLKANEHRPLSNLRFQENVSLIVRFPKLAETDGREIGGIKFYSDGLTPNGVTLRHYDDGMYEYELFFKKIDVYTGYLTHIQGHLCDPGDPECDDKK